MDQQNTLQGASTQLTAFTESLDNVGLTAAQVTAMKQASEGEKALTGDSSAATALLQAIMNSIKGDDTTVGGKYENLNTINIKLDDTSGFGFADSGQAIAAYNGQNLYTAIYGQCRKAVANDCNDASLQRAATAYLMAIEQDCNSVQTQLDANKKTMIAAARTQDAALDLARTKNRQEINSLDATNCLNAVQSAVQSEQVCGAGYRKCLDNGQFIDVTTGQPLQGVVEFYKLGQLLTFADNKSLADQRLTTNPKNRQFVQDFEKRVKQFAQPALNKCTEIADSVWADYLDKAMLDIHYAQQSKVDDIKTNCMGIVSKCYAENQQASYDALSGLINGAGLLAPTSIELQAGICQKYVDACDGMFAFVDDQGNTQNIVQQYMNNRQQTDLTDTCRAIVQNCFTNFGGSFYVNFYNPQSGLFNPDLGNALDWFTFSDLDTPNNRPVSVCAQQLIDTEGCDPADEDGGHTHKFAQGIFGGFDKRTVSSVIQYGYDMGSGFQSSQMRTSGVATEVYNNVINILSSDCSNLSGVFISKRFLDTDKYGTGSGSDALGNDDKICYTNFPDAQTTETPPTYYDIAQLYQIGTLTSSNTYDGKENICPLNYMNRVNVKSWGICSCWENGGRRSDKGNSMQCMEGSFSLLSACCPDQTDPTNCTGPCSQEITYGLPQSTNGIYARNVQKAAPNKVCPYALGQNNICLIWPTTLDIDAILGLVPLPQQ